jgi:undecaprenyl-diphosphatase
MAAMDLLTQLAQWDRAALLAINGLAHRSPFLDKIVVALAPFDCLAGGILFLFVWWLWFQPAAPEAQLQNRIQAFRVVVAVALAVVLARLLQTSLPPRLRPIHDASLPFVPPYGTTVNALEHYSSFPSDHAITLFTVVAAIWMRSRLAGALAALWAFILAGMTRIYIGYHYPGDVLAGAAIGVAIMAVLSNVPLPRGWTAWLFSWEQRHPQTFYGAAVLVTYQLITMGGEIRAFASSLTHIGTIP